MANKPFIDGGTADKNMWLVVRIVGGIIFTMVLSLMFIVNPHVNNDKFTNETLWEAVHPFHWFLDSLALIGTGCMFIYLLGYAGRIYELAGPKGSNSYGLTKVIFWVLVLCILLYYV